MPARTSLIKIASPRILVCFLILSLNIQGQTVQRPQDQSEVVRVFTDLIQTDVMVFDKQGRFVDDLRREDFELRIDGKVKPIEFFERISGGTTNEETQLSAARGNLSANKTSPLGAVPLDRGRTIFFYLDDLHLAPGSLAATRKVMTSFIENEMNQNDQASIASASGQIGFLQQLTDQKAVLRAALARVKYRPYSVRDFDRPAMTEYQALLIENNNIEVFEYFVEQVIIDNRISRQAAENTVRSRATNLLQQASEVTRNTLFGLNELVKSSSKLPGRKLVFFFSDGFLLDRRNSDSTTTIRKITSDAARNGVIIYSLDARGLVATLSDISVQSSFDVSGRLDRAGQGELVATQDAMNALARDTGGRPVFNSNALGIGLSRALQETSIYYLLAWKPNREAPEGKFRRIEVKLLEKPDLTVRVRRGFYDQDPAPAESKAKNSKPGAKTPEVLLREAIRTAYPDRTIPIALNLNYVHSPQDKRMMLSTTFKIPAESLDFSPEEGKQKASVQLLGLLFNDQGQSGARFSERLTMTAAGETLVKGSDAGISYAFPVTVGPGLYQVRVAARDEKSGRTGSAQGWIEIPDLSKGKLAISSVIIGRHSQSLPTDTQGNGQLAGQVDLNIERRYERNSVLRFVFFVYNAARATSDSQPDVATQIQLLRDNQPVLTTALKKIGTVGVDLDRLPYAADLSLADLPAGQYVLQVTAVDRVSKTSASQQNRFSIQ
ncbi:MAG: VWA domain-containing protein [Pyrinomonadaceae bacterium]|nr:VWA domain-containing protein [Pyrinomonadaceae bacterium]